MSPIVALSFSSRVFGPVFYSLPFGSVVALAAGLARPEEAKSRGTTNHPAPAFMDTSIETVDISFRSPELYSRRRRRG